MTFSSSLARLLWRGGFAGAVTALALAACGGGDSVEAFRPDRIISFGDESSALEPATAASAADPAASTALIGARKYGVNAYAVNASGVAQSYFDCRLLPLWNQVVANGFGLSFKACPGGATNANGLALATADAKVADVKVQVDNFLASADQPFRDKDIVTLMAGQNDVVEQFQRFPATPEATLIETMRARGKALAEQANRIATSGPAVIVVRIPDVGLTPWGVAQGADGAALLGRLTEAFNTSLQLGLINDGHLIGLVFGDTELRNRVQYWSAFGYVNGDAAVKTPWCRQAAGSTTRVDDTAVLLDCTVTTPSAAASAASAASASYPSTYYLWAGNLQMGPGAHGGVGSIALSRAQNNPF